MSERHEQWGEDIIPKGYERNVVVNPFTRRFMGLQLFDPIYVTSVLGEALDNRLLMEELLLEMQRMNTYLSLIVGEVINDEDVNER